MAFDQTDKPEHKRMIVEWLQYHKDNSCWCKAYLFASGNSTYMAVSLGMSTKQLRANDFHKFRNGIHTPAWYHYHVYRYQGLSLMNYHGLADSRYEGTLLSEKLGEFIRRQYHERGVAYSLGASSGGYDADSLRSQLGQLGIKVWVEVTSGYSYLAYRGLDVFIKAPIIILLSQFHYDCCQNPTVLQLLLLQVLGPDMPVPQEEAWYLLNATWDRMDQRRVQHPEFWYLCPDWISMGQRSIVDGSLYKPVSPLVFGRQRIQNPLRVRL